MIESGERLVLSLGFVSPHDPLDVLHFVTADGRNGKAPLYLERTDQELSCSDQVVRLACDEAGITLSLTEVGARSLGFGPLVRFSFGERPELFAVAARQVEAIGRSGHADTVEVCRRPAGA